MTANDCEPDKNDGSRRNGAQTPDFGADAMPDGERLGNIADRLLAHENLLEGHATLELLAWDDGDIEARLTHTVGFVAGAADTPPATMKQAVVYNPDADRVEYRETAVRAGDRDTLTREVIGDGQ